MRHLYPAEPGSKELGATSEEAADRAAHRCRELRQQCYNTLVERGPMTADEVARALRESPLSIRPRITELGMMGRIRRTGARRMNRSGCRAAVWKAIVKVRAPGHG